MEYVFSVSSYDEPAQDEELALALDARGAMSMKRRGAAKKQDAMKAPSAQACKVRKILGIAVMVLGGLMLLYVTTMQQRSKLLQIAGFLLLGAGLMVMRTANPDAKPAASARARQTAEKLLIALRKTDFAKDLHVTASSVCKWEQGQTFPDVIMLETIADYFELSMDDLYHPRQTLARVFDHSMD